jgi:HAD superfamily hydrolase (TIGR01509 family)
MGGAPAQRVVLFDVMGTLVHEPFPREVPEFFGLTLEELLRTKDPSAWAEFETGALDEAAFLRRFFRDRRAFDHEGLRRTMRVAYRWIEGMEAVLAGLGARGVALHAFSNYPPWYRWIESKLGLSRYLAWSFVSCETGLRKPDPAAYRLVLQRLGLPAERCLLVDDRPENCRAARDLGIPALLFRDAAALRAELGALDLDPGPHA